MNPTWIQTYTGRKFDPTNPEPEDVDIVDIAHALANNCRFTGHTHKHYSVGQHSVLGSYIVPPEYALHFLLHDASEAYLSDISKPVKRVLPDYREMEWKVQWAIMEKFGLNGKLPGVVKLVDSLMCFTEKRDLMGKEPADWGCPPYIARCVFHARRIRPWPIWYTKFRFLLRFCAITGRPVREAFDMFRRRPD